MNVCENVIVGAQLFPDHDALVFERLSLTYAELERQSSQAARILRESGVQRGDRVGIVLPNVPAFAVWYYAALRLGAIAVSISSRLAPGEVAFILADCLARAAVTTETDADRIGAELPDCVDQLLAVSEWGDPAQGELLASTAPLERPIWIDTEPHEPAAILYTSGTTGFPKGATLSHQNVRATVHAFNHLCGMRADDRMLLAVPLFHCYGQNALLNSALNVGATLVMQRRFDLNESKQLIADQQVTKLFGVPTTFQLLWEYCESVDLRSVEYCFSAAATLPIQLSQNWQEKFGMPIFEGYGLTETAPFASYNHRAHYVPGSIGTPVDLVEMKIVDPETGHTCGPETAGEIVIRGPNVMLGYWDRPEETAVAIRDGWFHSGDIGRMDERGYFYIVDRLKDMIAIGGMKVFPAEVERVLLDDPTVSEAAVVGFPDPVFGEQVVAFVVGTEAQPDAHRIHLHCRANLADFKTPKRIVLVDQLPRNATGKVLKTRLRETDLAESKGTPASNATDSGTSRNAVEPTAGEPATLNSTHGSTVADGPPAPLVAKMRRVHMSGRKRALTSLLQEEVKELVQLGEPPDPEAKLVESGLDSLMVVELRDRLQLLVGPELSLPATLVFDYPRICDLASFLNESLDFDGRSAGDSGSTSKSAAMSSPDLIKQKEKQTDTHAELSTSVGNDDTAQRSKIDSMSEQQALHELLREINE